ncbi:MAG: GntR family transcriptional regulator [Rhodoblastus sp.]
MSAPRELEQIPDDALPAIGQRERVQRAIEHDIASGNYKAGQRLDEREIANRLNVSRTPVREALNRLASIGLVEARPNQGSFVTSMTLQDFLQQYEFMADLEALCARLAARRMEELARARLRQLAVEGSRAAEQGDVESYIPVNLEFHQVIYSATRNRFLEQSIFDLRRRMAHYRGFSIRLPGRLARSAEEHVAIANAIIHSDADEAHRLMRWHMELLKPESSDFLIAVSQTLS